MIRTITKCLFSVGVHLRQLSTSRVHGVDEGNYRTFEGLKKCFFVSLSKLSLKWVIAGIFARYFRILS